MAGRNEVLACLALLGMAYPKEAGQYKDPRTIELWVRMLADLPGDLLVHATQECIASLSWFPKIAELRQAAAIIQLAADPVPAPHAAWGEVLREMERVGRLSRYGMPLAFSHPLVEEVVEMFGWTRLCEAENLVSERAQFLQAYTQRSEQRLAEARQLAETRQYIQLQAKTNHKLLAESSAQHQSTPLER